VKIDVNEINPTRKTVVATFSAEEVDAEEKNVLKEFSKHAKIPGFRPGKAPEKMLRQRFKSEIASELNQRILRKAFEEVQESDEIDLLQVINVENDPFVAGQEGSATLTVDVFPKFELPAYEGIEVTVPPADVEEKEVDDIIERIRNERAEYEVVEREAAKGDYVKVSYKGMIDGQPVGDIATDYTMYGEQANTWEEAGAEDGMGVKAVVEGVVGMKPGDKKTVEQDFAEDFEVEALRGKKASYEIEVHEVREKCLPEMNEEFLETLQAESEEDLRKRILDDLKSRKEQEIDQRKRSEASGKLVELVDFPLPESAVEGEKQNLLRGHMQRLMQQGITQEQMEAHKDQMLESAGQAARNQVKLQFILGEIAKKEEIKIENEDLQQRIMQEAYATRTRPDDIVKELQKDRNRLVQLQRDTLFAKALDFVVDKATVTISADAAEDGAEQSQ